MYLGRQIAQEPLLRIRQLGSRRGTAGFGCSLGTVGVCVWDVGCGLLIVCGVGVGVKAGVGVGVKAGVRVGVGGVYT
jgi:hypothetical protein